MHVPSGRRAAMLLAAIAAFALASAATAVAQPHAGIRYSEIPNGAYSIVAEVRARPGRERELREATLPLVALVRSDPANLVYFLQEDREVPGRFIFYEVFASRADFEAHNSMPYVQAWFARLGDLADGGVTVRRMEILGHAGSE